MSLLHRPRRNRKSSAIRNLVQEHHVTPNDLVAPFFVLEDEKRELPIHSMPNCSRLGIYPLLKELELLVPKGLQSVILFPVVEEHYKDKVASFSHTRTNFYLNAIHQIKKHFPELAIITDVAMDPYSVDGHDGLVDNGRILNDETLPILGEMALAQAEAGADIIGPSDMMDGRIGFIRNYLDQNGFQEVSLMSYTAKYASAFYGPFRDALDSAPKSGDKLTYQMHPANSREALIEAYWDTQEGADFLMVKPALSYLDVIQTLKQNSNLPIVAYNVSGEYSMIKAAAEKGWINEQKVRDEVLLSMKRAGADILITYFTKDILLSL